MKKIGVLLAIAGLVYIFFLSGCVMTPREERMVRGGAGGAAVGAGLGALGGAIVGGDPGRGAAAGAVIGGALGALNEARRPVVRGRRGQLSRGDGGYYDRRDPLDCDDLENEKDQLACKRGKEKGAARQATRVKRECAQIAQKYGYFGRGYPEDLPDNYEEKYQQSCRDGLAKGYQKGEERRAKRIERNAERYEAGR